MPLINSQLFDKPLDSREFSLDENLALVDFPAIASGKAFPKAADFLGYGGILHQFGDLASQFSEVKFSSILDGDIRMYLRRGADNVCGVRIFLSLPAPLLFGFFKFIFLDPIGSDIPTTLTDGDVIRAEVSGNQIRLLKNGAIVAMRQDSDLSNLIASGKPGFALHVSSGTPSGVSISHWGGGDLDKVFLQRSDGSTLNNFLNPLISRMLVERGIVEIITPGKTGFGVVRLKPEHDAAFALATPENPITVGMSSISFLPVLFPQVG